MAAGTTDGPSLAGAIRAPRIVEGALATYRFNGSGDPTRGAVLLEVRADSAILRATAAVNR